MKTTLEEPAAAADGNETFALASRETISRREFLAGAAAVGVTISCLDSSPRHRPEEDLHHPAHQ